MRRVVSSLGSCVLLAAAGVALAACGEDERQDANESEGTYRVELVEASFPTKQSLAEASELKIGVRNAGDEAIPNVAVTIGRQGEDSFNVASDQPGMADPESPVWIIDNVQQGPPRGTTAYVNTWTLGRLAPGQTRTFTWNVTAVKPGSHTLAYRVNGGLSGKARAELPGGGVPEGKIEVEVTGRPSPACVDDAGEVVRGRASPTGECPG